MRVAKFIIIMFLPLFLASAVSALSMHDLADEVKPNWYKKFLYHEDVDGVGYDIYETGIAKDVDFVWTQIDADTWRVDYYVNQTFRAEVDKCSKEDSLYEQDVCYDKIKDDRYKDYKNIDESTDSSGAGTLLASAKYYYY